MYCFSQDDTEKIITHFGKAFYEKVLQDVEICSKNGNCKLCKWSVIIR